MRRVEQARRSTLPLLHAQPRRAHRRDLSPARSAADPETGTGCLMTKLLDALAERVLLSDGGIGSRVQEMNLDISRDYWDAENCTEVLNLSRPDVILDIHRGYLEAGSDVIQTNSFGGS